MQHLRGLCYDFIPRRSVRLLDVQAAAARWGQPRGLCWGRPQRWHHASTQDAGTLGQLASRPPPIPPPPTRCARHLRDEAGLAAAKEETRRRGERMRESHERNKEARCAQLEARSAAAR